jgi:hypothetical protein
MEFHQIISFGYDCDATYIVRFFEIYKGCSPFDWIKSKPESVSKILALLYTYGMHDITTKLTFNDKNTVEELNLWAPHYNESEFKDKMNRRLRNFYYSLTDLTQNILFFYSGEYDTDNTINPEDIIKLSKLIKLYRPLNTFRIILIENSDAYKNEHINIYIPNGIVYLKIDRVDTGTFWVEPCRFAIKKAFPNLEFVKKE